MTHSDPRLVIVISAPSGAGKSTIISRLMKEDSSLEFSISHTTRSPRGKETNGNEYYFIDRKTFTEMINQKAFLEWAEVHGNFYGTSYSEINRLTQSGKRVILDIDVQGSKILQNSHFPAIYIFITIPSIDELKKRLINRGTDSAEVIERRLAAAAKEIRDGLEWPHVVVNDDLDKAFHAVRCIVLPGMRKL